MTQENNDREMLELAAKAYGDQAVRVDYAGGRRWIGRNEEIGCDVFVEWNPLTDDGDALRLAVKLNLWEPVQLAHRLVGSEDCPNLYAATRRAITRAAAEIGKAMP